MYIERKEKGTRTITLHADEAAIIFHEGGVTFDGLNPRVLAEKPEAFKELLEMAPHMMNWFDCAEMVHKRTYGDESEPWECSDDYNARN